MKIVFDCVICGSADVTKKLGQFAPFVAHRLFDYPTCKISVGGASVFPMALTNALRCPHCGFVFSQIRPDGDEMARLYAGYRGPDYVRGRDTYEPGYRDVNPLIGDGPVEIENRQQAMAEFLGAAADLSGVRRVLDYGGDRGQHIPRMFSGCEKIVFDISGQQSAPGVRSVNAIEDARGADFVMISNVLEHVSYPPRLLEEVLAVAAPEARLFLDVPLEMSPEPEIGEDEIPAFFHEHINFFTPRSLGRLIEVAGLAVERIEVKEIDLGWIKSRSIFALASPIGVK